MFTRLNAVIFPKVDVSTNYTFFWPLNRLTVLHLKKCVQFVCGIEYSPFFFLSQDKFIWSAPTSFPNSFKFSLELR